MTLMNTVVRAVIAEHDMLAGETVAAH
jgi:hypothetical protein